MDSIFLIHWNEKEAKNLANHLIIEDIVVDIEFEDDLRAFERIKIIEPSIILIFLTRLPSLGRKIAKSLKNCSETHEIPLIFIDGKDKYNNKLRKEIPDAIYTTSNKLDQVIRLFKN